MQQSANPSSSELSSDMERLLQFSLKDEDDDATSKAAPMTSELEQQSYNRHPPSPAPYQVMLDIKSDFQFEVLFYPKHVDRHLKDPRHKFFSLLS